MAQTNVNPQLGPSRHREFLRILIGVLIVLVLGLLTIAVINGAVQEYDETDKQTEPGAHQTQQVQSAPEGTLEPSNPNVTGGESGGGTGQSNDATTPSTPAGGVDTNNYQTP